MYPCSRALVSIPEAYLLFISSFSGSSYLQVVHISLFAGPSSRTPVHSFVCLRSFALRTRFLSSYVTHSRAPYNTFGPTMHRCRRRLYPQPVCLAPTHRRKDVPYVEPYLVLHRALWSMPCTCLVPSMCVSHTSPVAQLVSRTPFRPKSGHYVNLRWKFQTTRVEEHTSSNADSAATCRCPTECALVSTLFMGAAYPSSSESERDLQDGRSSCSEVEPVPVHGVLRGSR